MLPAGWISLNLAQTFSRVRSGGVPASPAGITRFRVLASVLIAQFLLPGRVGAAESWSDERLPVLNGLELWFDCGRQVAARAQMRMPAPPQGGLDYLLDGSGHGRHASQSSVTGRPRLVREGREAFLLFDGQDDALAGGLSPQEAAALTMFVVAVPLENPGGFRAFFSLARAGVNDFQSGLNLDLGPRATPQLSFVNAEGAGAGGASQLMESGPLPFGGWHVFSLESQVGERGVRFAVDGKSEGSRRRNDSVIALDQMVLGARCYSHSSEAPFVQGFFKGAIAELLLFSRVLEPAEKSVVELYLRTKHAALIERAPEAWAQTAAPAVIEIPGEPRPRARAEVEAILKLVDAVATLPRDPEPFEVVLCAGPKDHGAGEHDYPLWQSRWKTLLATSKNVRIGTAWEWPSPEQWEQAKVVVFYSNNPGWNAARAKVLNTFLDRGGGLVYIHYSVDGHGEVEALADCIGYAWRGGVSKFRHGPLELRFAESPLAAGFESAHFIDESYWNLVGAGRGVQVVATGIEEGKPQPLIWTRSQGRGRVCVNILGHYTWTFDDPLFRILLLRGICWAGGQPVDRLSHLAFPGARVLE